ncbi:hypothetical protein [Inhella sp.]|uniref:hypothetical protein n=1 Tax=Inhella sp. TaxID=1921806 RepID=UPI0035B4B485
MANETLDVLCQSSWTINPNMADRRISSDWESFEVQGRRIAEPTFRFWRADGTSCDFSADEMRRDRWWEVLEDAEVRLIQASLDRVRPASPEVA